MSNIEQMVLKAIDDLRPYLKDDGGDMELVEITDDKTIIVELLGACKTCSISPITIKTGLESNLKALDPEIKKVETI
tara:strand:- start:17571 stop:17801 length:231 start_codon:yes stop_codon:yes gene_type:complete